MSDWSAAADPNSGLIYYYNRETGETQWEAPEGFENDDNGENQNFIEVIDQQSGRVYLFNPETGEAKWLDSDADDEEEWTEEEFSETEEIPTHLDHAQSGTPENIPDSSDVFADEDVDDDNILRKSSLASVLVDDQDNEISNSLNEFMNYSSEINEPEHEQIDDGAVADQEDEEYDFSEYDMSEEEEAEDEQASNPHDEKRINRLQVSLNQVTEINRQLEVKLEELEDENRKLRYDMTEKDDIIASLRQQLKLVPEDAKMKIEEDEDTINMEERVGFLKSVPLFHSMTENQISNLARELHVQKCVKGEVIIRQGDLGDNFYIIQDGTVAVLKREGGKDYADGDFGIHVAELRGGFFFGERALVTSECRAATCMGGAKGCTCLVLGKQVFTETLAAVKDILGNYSKFYHTDDEGATSSLSRHVSAYSQLIQSQQENEPTQLMQTTSRYSRAPSLTTLEDDLRDMEVSNALSQIITAFSPELDHTDVISRMITIIRSLIPVEYIRMAFLNEHNNLVLRHSDISEETGSEFSKIGLIGRCFSDNTTILLNDKPHLDSIFALSDCPQKLDSNEIENTLLCAVPDPRPKAKGSIAVIQLLNKQNSFLPSDKDILESICRQLANVFKHKQSQGGLRNAVSICSIKSLFKVRIVSVKDLPIVTKSAQTVKIHALLYHSGVILAPPMSTVSDIGAWSSPPAQSKTPHHKSGLSRISADLDCVLESVLSLRDVPRASRLIMNVFVDDEPVAWTGIQLCSFKRMLRLGKMELSLISGHCDGSLAAVASQLQGPPLSRSKKGFGRLIVELMAVGGTSKQQVVFEDNRALAYGLNTSIKPASSKCAHVFEDMVKSRLSYALSGDPLMELTEQQKVEVFESRHQLKHFAKALPVFLRSVPWNDYDSVQEAYRLLREWAEISPIDALQLLDAQFPDPKVRAYAVEKLESLSDEDLSVYMLQLTQVLKFEPFIDNALSRFLLRRALRNTHLVGHVFFWYLKAEMHIPAAKGKFGFLLECYLRNCGSHRQDIGHQMFVLHKLEIIAHKVAEEDTKQKRNECLKDELRRIVFPDEFQLPLSPHMVASGIDIEQCRVMNSKKKPLFLVFKNSKKGMKPHVVLFKVGDDLRQDQLTLQILNVMTKIWKEHGLDFKMSPYRCVSTGDEVGMLEIVPNSMTLAEIVAAHAGKKRKGFGKKFKAAVSVFSNDSMIRNWLEKERKSQGNAWDTVQENFALSCAGYCVATYVLGIGDRHNDNIMLSRDGKFFHIDFGHFLGNFKSKLGWKRERAPFVFTTQFAAVLDKQGSPMFKKFEHYSSRAFNILRKHSPLLLTLFFLMLQCGIPELQTESDIDYMHKKLMMNATEERAAKRFCKEIKKSLKTKSTLFNDACHLLKHA